MNSKPRRPFVSLSGSILKENDTNLLTTLLGGGNAFILVLGSEMGKELLGLAEDFPSARILGIESDEFKLVLSERLLKDKSNVQILNPKDFARHFSALELKFDLVIVEEMYERSPLVQDMKFNLIKSRCALLLNKEPYGGYDTKAEIEIFRSLGFSNFKIGEISELEAGSFRFLLAQR